MKLGLGSGDETVKAIVVTSAREFLARKGHSAEDVERMHAAWTKAVMLTIALWARPYAKEGLW